MAKQYLEQHNLEFETIDITEKPEAREFLLAEGHKTMPQIYHNGKLLVEGGAQALTRLSPSTIRELIGDIDVSSFGEL